MKRQNGERSSQSNKCIDNKKKSQNILQPQQITLDGQQKLIEQLIRQISDQILKQIDEQVGYDKDSKIERIDLQDLCNILSNKKTKKKCNVQVIILLWQICPNRDQNGKIKISYLALKIANYLLKRDQQTLKNRNLIIKLFNIKNQNIVENQIIQWTKNEIHQNLSWIHQTCKQIIFFNTKFNQYNFLKYFISLICIFLVIIVFLILFPSILTKIIAKFILRILAQLYGFLQRKLINSNKKRHLNG